MSGRPERNRLAVDQGAFHGQAPHRLRDLGQPIGKVRPVARPERRPAAFLARDDPIAVVLDLVQPPGPAGGWSTSFGRQGRMKPVGPMRREREGGVRHNMPRECRVWERKGEGDRTACKALEARGVTSGASSARLICRASRRQQ